MFSGRRNRGKQRDSQPIKDNHSNTSNNNSTSTSHPSNVPEIKENGSAVLLVLKNNNYHSSNSGGQHHQQQNHQGNAGVSVACNSNSTNPSNSVSQPSVTISSSSSTTKSSNTNNPSQHNSSNQHQHQPEHCESCNRLEIELKKVRTELSQLKQTENELRQKCDQNTAVKNCLQAKQKENDELEKKYVFCR